MTPEDPAESIRRRMAELRRELTFDVRDVGRSARAMANPSFYIRKFPWATLAVAAAVGYMLIPKKRQVVYPDPDAIAELVRKKQVRVEASAAGKETKGVLETLLVMGLTWAARTGMGYVGQQLMRTGVSKTESAQPESASPQQEARKTKR